MEWQSGGLHCLYVIVTLQSPIKMIVSFETGFAGVQHTSGGQ